MLTAPSRPRRPQALQALVAEPDTRQQLQQAARPLPDDVTTYLGQLSLLYSVPFANLVPDARMLPPESIRFFFLDRNWLDALVDGALSVVDLTGPDHALLEALQAPIRDQVRLAADAERSRRQGIARATPPSGEEVWLTGFLLRSALVSDWPGLHVTAFGDAAGTDPLDLLRLDRVAPTVLLGIVKGLTQQLRLAKPAQGLHYGALQDGDHPDVFNVYLRGLGGAQPAGPQLPGDPAVPAPMRAGGRMVLDTANLHAAIEQRMAAAYAPAPAPPVHPAAFGLQLIAGAELQVFVPAVERAQPEELAP